MKKTFLIILTIVILIAGLTYKYWFWYIPLIISGDFIEEVTPPSTQTSNELASQAGDEPKFDCEGKGDVGIIVDTGNGVSTYRSDKYKFTFEFPTAWSIGNNHIGCGTFQLKNYNPSMQDGNPHGFAKGTGKIEMFAGVDESFLGGAEMKEIEIAGQKAYESEDTFYGSTTYIIEFPSRKGEYLSISRYGDSAVGAAVLKQILESLRWL